MNNNPIGIFDSGVGGLSVLQQIRRRLPLENFIYVADSAFAPYGDKPELWVEQRCIDITRFLTDQQAKAIVLACNTATAAAVSRLRSLFDQPIVAMEPAIKPAAGLSRSRVVGILATAGTIASEKYSRLINRFQHDCRFISQPCPGLVEEIEQGQLNSAAIEILLQKYITPLLDQHADTLVLGCTHYPLIAEQIKSIAGRSVNVIDGNAAVAAELERQLLQHQLSNSSTSQGAPVEQFWSSGNPASASGIFTRLWNNTVQASRLPAELMQE